MMTDSDSVTLNISFTSDLPNGIYKYVFDLYFSATCISRLPFSYTANAVGLDTRHTIYEHWNVTLQGNDTQNANGGFFHPGYGRMLTFSGEFRHFGDHLRNLGLSYSVNSEGVYNSRAVARTLIGVGGGCIFIYSDSA